MLITKGSRRVTLGTATVCVEASCALIIPAGVVHMAREGPWTGFNAYLEPDRLSNTAARLLRIESLPSWTGERDEACLGQQCDALLDLISDVIPIWEDPSIEPFSFVASDTSDWPTSREGQIRRYRREAGISPYAHMKAAQLNQARRRIAHGERIASVAADLGFTDQAHMGRQFKASYGTSPGRYANS
ncbi:helix-turn-helix domain-containing protein [Pseudophaeobacter sp.]|uniref:helix-turn-helix domain-containing protein n=1 Tax=Pseudophaeobacter sp. TaxID=1971739 RepID=UPI00262A37BE|nr:helix-turn-helix domain-containing protein [Pseudophaeobacter sp.]